MLEQHSKEERQEEERLGAEERPELTWNTIRVKYWIYFLLCIKNIIIYVCEFCTMNFLAKKKVQTPWIGWYQIIYLGFAKNNGCLGICYNGRMQGITLFKRLDKSRTFFNKKKTCLGKWWVRKPWIRNTRGEVAENFLRLIPNFMYKNPNSANFSPN